MAFDVTLNAQQQRVAALLLLFIPIAVFVGLVYAYVSDVALQREQIAILLRERSRYSALAETVPALRRQLLRVRAASAGGELVFVARSADAAAKLLQTQVANLITADGGSGVQAKTELNAIGDDGPVEVHADVSFSASVAELTKILFALRQSRPLLFPTRLWIHGAPSQATGPNSLQVELAVVGYSRLP